MDIGTLQAFFRSRDYDLFIFISNVCTQRLETHNVLVNGTRTNVVAARETNNRFTETTKQSTHKVV